MCITVEYFAHSCTHVTTRIFPCENGPCEKVRTLINYRRCACPFCRAQDKPDVKTELIKGGLVRTPDEDILNGEKRMLRQSEWYGKALECTRSIMCASKITATQEQTRWEAEIAKKVAADEKLGRPGTARMIVLRRELVPETDLEEFKVDFASIPEEKLTCPWCWLRFDAKGEKGTVDAKCENPRRLKCCGVIIGAECLRKVFPDPQERERRRGAIAQSILPNNISQTSPFAAQPHSSSPESVSYPTHTHNSSGPFLVAPTSAPGGLVLQTAMNAGPAAGLQAFHELFETFLSPDVGDSQIVSLPPGNNLVSGDLTYLAYQHESQQAAGLTPTSLQQMVLHAQEMQALTESEGVALMNAYMSLEGQSSPNENEASSSSLSGEFLDENSEDDWLDALVPAPRLTSTARKPICPVCRKPCNVIWEPKHKAVAEKAWDKPLCAKEFDAVVNIMKDKMYAEDVWEA